MGQEKAPLRNSRDEGSAVLAAGPEVLEIGDVQSALPAGGLMASLATALQKGLDILGKAHPGSRFRLRLASAEKEGRRQDRSG